MDSPNRERARPGPESPELSDPLASPAFRAPGFGELLQTLLGARRPLDCVQVEVSSVCPGRCVYCPHSTRAGVWRSRHMADATLAALWPLFRQAGRVHLQGWGEPLLHPRFLDYAAFARRAGCRVSSTSCGLRMDEALATGLVDSGIDILAFSLAGTDEASNGIRTGVPFARVCEAIRTLQTVRKARLGVHLEIHIAYLLLADRMEAVLDLPELMADLGVHAAVVSTLDLVALPEHAALALAPHETEKRAAAKDLLEKAAARAAALELGFHYALPGPSPAPGCRENVARTLYVDADGALSPCIYSNLPTDEALPERRILGRANESDPFQTWKGPRFEAFRNALTQGRPELPCVDCAKRFEQIT